MDKNLPWGKCMYDLATLQIRLSFEHSLAFIDEDGCQEQAETSEFILNRIPTIHRLSMSTTHFIKNDSYIEALQYLEYCRIFRKSRLLAHSLLHCWRLFSEKLVNSYNVFHRKCAGIQRLNPHHPLPEHSTLENVFLDRFSLLLQNYWFVSLYPAI